MYRYRAYTISIFPLRALFVWGSKSAEEETKLDVRVVTVIVGNDKIEMIRFHVEIVTRHSNTLSIRRRLLFTRIYACQWTLQTADL